MEVLLIETVNWIGLHTTPQIWLNFIQEQVNIKIDNHLLKIFRALVTYASPSRLYENCCISLTKDLTKYFPEKKVTVILDFLKENNLEKDPEVKEKEIEEDCSFPWNIQIIDADEF